VQLLLVSVVRFTVGVQNNFEVQVPTPGTQTVKSLFLSMLRVVLALGKITMNEYRRNTDLQASIRP